VRGEPIVESPADSYRCFMGTNMDALVIENFLLLRKEQPQDAAIDRKAYLSAFALD
jgi:carbamoyltransferase